MGVSGQPHPIELLQPLVQLVPIRDVQAHDIHHRSVRFQQPDARPARGALTSLAVSWRMQMLPPFGALMWCEATELP